MAGGWPTRIVGRSVGLRGGTARQSRPRGSVLGSAASRCVVGFPLLPHSLTVSSVVPTVSTFARPLDSRRFPFFLVFAFRPRRLVRFSRPVSLTLFLCFSLHPLRRCRRHHRRVALSRAQPRAPSCLSSALVHATRPPRVLPPGVRFR